MSGPVLIGSLIGINVVVGLACGAGPALEFLVLWVSGILWAVAAEDRR